MKVKLIVFFALIALTNLCDFLVTADSTRFKNVGDTLYISTNNKILNFSSDSLLKLEVLFKNYNKKTIRHIELWSNSRGLVCRSPMWSILITKIDSNQQYEPPILLCNGVPEGNVRKNEEYKFYLTVNFKYINKPTSIPALNHDYGEYTFQLILKDKTDLIRSNTITILFQDTINRPDKKLN
jgi:hypothetical protein